MNSIKQIQELIEQYHLQDQLEWQTDRLSLQEQAIFFDFVAYLQKFTKSRAPRGPLYSALKKERNSTIIDATMGTGKDALLLVSWGFKLICFERNPLVYLLLLDALRRLQQSEFSHFSEQLDIRVGECFSQLEQFMLPATRLVVYYDPMYPKHESERKSALPRRDIQLLRSIVQEDRDIEKNLNLARQYADKTILKRAIHSKQWELPFKAQESLKGKNTRYDIFFHI